MTSQDNQGRLQISEPTRDLDIFNGVANTCYSSRVALVTTIAQTTWSQKKSNMTKSDTKKGRLDIIELFQENSSYFTCQNLSMV